MRNLLTVVLLLALAQSGRAANSQLERPPRSDSAIAPEGATAGLPALPAAPQGKSTILGGKIRQVDPVRDQFLLDIYGQRPMKILYDERTQVFLDGRRIPVRSLGSEDRASVQTILDGSNVFAISIHILTHAAEGDCEGRVVSYNPDSNALAIASDLSPEPVRLRVGADTAIERIGESEFTSVRSGVADLVPGALVDAAFTTDAGGRDVATRITVFAVPGAGFAFFGNISFLDLQRGLLTLVDPRDKRSYEIRFSPSSLPVSQSLHLGETVSVAAIYNGTQYEASTITVDSSTTPK